MKRESVNRNDLNALLGPGCVFKGNLSFRGTVLIDGTVEGEVATDDIIQVGNQGTVTGEVKAGEVIISGTLQGTVNARRILLRSGGKLKGTLVAASLEVEEGAILDGECHMKDAAGERKRQEA